MQPPSKLRLHKAREPQSEQKGSTKRELLRTHSREPDQFTRPRPRAFNPTVWAPRRTYGHRTEGDTRQNTPSESPSRHPNHRRTPPRLPKNHNDRQRKSEQRGHEQPRWGDMERTEHKRKPLASARGNPTRRAQTRALNTK